MPLSVGLEWTHLCPWLVSGASQGREWAAPWGVDRVAESMVDNWFLFLYTGLGVPTADGTPMGSVSAHWPCLHTHPPHPIPTVHASTLTRDDPTVTAYALYPLASPSHLLATPLHFSLSLPLQTLTSVPLIRAQQAAPVWIRWTALSASAQSSGWGLLASWVRAP